MSVLERLQAKPAVAVAVVCLLAAVVVTLRSMSAGGPRSPQESAYYFALDAGEIVVAPMDTPPVTLPDQSRGVIAKMFGCGNCGEADRYVAYLETFTDEARAVLVQGPPEGDRSAYDRATLMGRLVAATPAAGEQPAWVPAQSSQGAAIIAESTKQCTSARPIACYP